MLRRVLLILGVAGLVAALACLLMKIYVAALYLFLEGAVLIVALLFERWRYVRSVNRNNGYWQATGERFLDPSSGKLVDVYYNSATGERDYQDTQKS